MSIFYNKVKDIVEEFREDYNYPNDGTAFGHFCIKECFTKIMDFGFDGNDDEFNEFIKNHCVDRANDLGNDVIFGDTKNNRIFIFQFKYSKSSLLNSTEIKKNKTFIDWLLGLENEEQKPNHILKNIIETELKPILTEDNINKKNYEIVFIYVDSNFDEKLDSVISSLFANYRDKNINFEVKKYNHSKLDVLYEDIEVPHNEVVFEIIPEEYFIKKYQYFNESPNTNIELETIIGSLLANSLKKVVEQEGESIFSLNVRYFKGENEINSKMKREYEKGSESNFWILNNGINAICEEFNIKVIEDRTYIKIKNLQIVNGGQTTKILTKIINELPNSVQLLMKLTKIKNKDVVSIISKNISIASNSQNAITFRDLHSNDKIQRFISDKLNDCGVFYDKKDGEWNTLKVEQKKKYKIPNKKTYYKINNTDLGLCYMSFFNQLPFSNKGRKKLVFSDIMYGDIFDSSKGENNQFIRLIFSYKLMEYIKEYKNNLKSTIAVLESTYINDLLLSLSALYFVSDTTIIKNENDLKNELISLNLENYINEKDCILKLDEDFLDYFSKIIEAIKYLNKVKSGIAKATGELWKFDNYIKNENNYKEILLAVIEDIQ
jgi:hypothetical protein